MIQILYSSYDNSTIEEHQGCWSVIDKVSPDVTTDDGCDHYIEWFTEQGALFGDSRDGAKWLIFNNDDDAIVFRLRHGV